MLFDHCIHFVCNNYFESNYSSMDIEEVSGGFIIL